MAGGFLRGSVGGGLVAVWLAISGGAVAGEDTVGNFGDLRRWQINGAIQVDAAEVRGALDRDLTTQLACHPLAPRGELAAAVTARVLAGLQNAGFGDARVDVTLDEPAERLRIDIAEGRRYLCGSVRIEGAGNVPLESLRDRLTRPYPPAKAVRPAAVQRGAEQSIEWLDRDGKRVKLADPVWRPGDSAPLDGRAVERLTKHVREALENLGYRDARFTVELVRHADTKLVDLLVRVPDLGPLATLTDITVVGNERSTDEAILAWLSIRPGDVLTRRRQAELETALWQSGRFVRHEVRVESAAGGRGTSLRIDVAESPFAPPVGEPLSREAEALRRARDWLADPQGWNSDLVVTFHTANGRTQMILAPQHGLLASHQPSAPEAPPTFLLLATADKVTWRVAGLPQRLEVPLTEGRLELRLNIALQEKPTEEGKPFWIRVDFGFTSEREPGTDGPVMFSVNLQPAAAAAMPRARAGNTTWQGSHLVLENAVESLVVDEASGRLIDCRSRGDGGEATVAFVDGAFEKQRAAWQPLLADLPNAFNAQRPLTTCLMFFCDAFSLLRDWPEKLPEQTRAFLASLPAVRTMLERDVLQDVDAMMAQDSSTGTTEFDLPADGPDPASGVAALVGQGALAAATAFPRGSWLWTVCRETGFAAVGQTKYTSRTLQQLYAADQIGPVGALAVSELLTRVDPRLARTFAARGLWDTSVTGFRRDFLPLLDENAISGRLLARATVILQELDESAAARLLANLPAADRPWLAAIADQLRRDHQLPVEVALPAALERGWNDGLRARVTAALEARREPSVFAPQQP